MGYDGYTNDTASNTMCVAVDAPVYEVEGEEEEEQDNKHRLLKDDKNNKNDGNGYMSTMGCDADGNYAIAGFKGYTCDGNYYSDHLDSFKAYNRQHSRIGCHKVWADSTFHKGDRYTIETLLNNSWSCDMELYPNGCPDPYGKKERWSYAIQTLGKGGNAQLAYRNMLIKWPLRVLGFCMAGLGAIIFMIAYWIMNRERILAKGCKTRRQKLAGFFSCLVEDFLEILVGAKEGIKKRIRARREKLRRRRERRQKRKERGKSRSKRSKKSSKTDQKGNDADDNVVDDQVNDHYDRYDSRIV